MLEKIEIDHPDHFFELPYQILWIGLLVLGLLLTDAIY